MEWMEKQGCCGAEGSRIPDLLRAKEALSQLSYSPVADTSIWRSTGLGKGRGVVCLENKQEGRLMPPLLKWYRLSDWIVEGREVSDGVRSGFSQAYCLNGLWC